MINLSKGSRVKREEEHLDPMLLKHWKHSRPKNVVKILLASFGSAAIVFGLLKSLNVFGIAQCFFFAGFCGTITAILSRWYLALKVKCPNCDGYLYWYTCRLDLSESPIFEKFKDQLDLLPRKHADVVECIICKKYCYLHTFNYRQ